MVYYTFIISLMSKAPPSDINSTRGPDISASVL